jgi:hypothetical protein
MTGMTSSSTFEYRAGTVVEHTKLACQTLAGRSAEEAVRDGERCLPWPAVGREGARL